jgi:hypothetical protein
LAKTLVACNLNPGLTCNADLATVRIDFPKQPERKIDIHALFRYWWSRKVLGNILAPLSSLSNLFDIFLIIWSLAHTFLFPVLLISMLLQPKELSKFVFSIFNDKCQFPEINVTLVQNELSLVFVPFQAPDKNIPFLYLPARIRKPTRLFGLLDKPH